MRYSAMTAGVVFVALAGWLLRDDARELERFRTATVRTAAQAAPAEAPAPAASQPAPPPNGEAPLDTNGFLQRMQLSSLDLHRFHQGTVALRYLLEDRKGHAAKSTRISPTTLVLEIPGLALSDAELEDLFIAELGTEMGLAKATALWDDIPARRYVLDQLHLDWVRSPSSFTLHRVTEEGPPDHGYAEPATFNIDGTLGSNRQRWEYRGVRISAATGIPWSALATAPVGFFSRTPLVKPRGLTVIEVGEAGQPVIIRNARSAGSRDVIPSSP